MPTRVFLAAVLLSFPVLSSTTEPAPTNRAYKVERYTVQVTLDMKAQSVYVDELIDLRVLSEASQLQFDLQEMAVQAISDSRTNLPFDSSHNYLTVRFPRPLTRSRHHSLRITMAGKPSKGLIFEGDEAFTVYNTSHWLAVDHRPGDLVRFTLSVTAPVGTRIIGNGRNVHDSVHGKQHTSTWENHVRSPDFVLGFAVGPFQTASESKYGIDFRYLSATLPPDSAKRAFHLTPRALALFSKRAGRPYPFKSYATVLVSGKPEQELASFTLLRTSYGQLLLDHPEEAWLEAHELAHQWWGIGVACAEWSEFWLNEGISTFMADVFLGEVFGKARYDHEIDIAKQIYVDLKSKGKDHPLCYTGHGEADVGGRLPYFKGAVVLDRLRNQIGEKAFWRGLQIYTTDHWGKTATSLDFEYSMEQACGHSLRPFFDEWVFH